MSDKALPDILARIVARRRRALAEVPAAGEHPAGRDVPLSQEENAFVAALARRRGGAVIAEVKLGSPRLGDLRPRLDPRAQAESYARAGAAALSVVVEPAFFHGSYELLRDCRRAAGLPALAKDFVVDPRQLVWARDAGADAVLLIAALQPRQELHRLAATARALGLAPLVELHTAEDVDKLTGADWELVGINHRDLRTFDVDLAHSEPLLPRLPAGALKVAESGIASGSDVAELASRGFDAFLVGEALLTADDPGAQVEELVAAGTEFSGSSVGSGSRPRSARSGPSVTERPPLTAAMASAPSSWEGTRDVLIKVCGVTRVEDAVHAAELGVDCLGLNFYPDSPRYVSVERAAEIADAVRGRMALFGVFVNAPRGDIERVVETVGLDRVQFHGDESPEDVAPWGYRAVKVIRVVGRPSPWVWDAYPEVWGFLIEARHDSLYGGTGTAWDYDVLRDLGRLRPWLLAGGVGPGNVRRALDVTGAPGVDICSGVESAPGTKDAGKMEALVRAVRDMGGRAGRKMGE